MVAFKATLSQAVPIVTSDAGADLKGMAADAVEKPVNGVFTAGFTASRLHGCRIQETGLKKLSSGSQHFLVVIEEEGIDPYGVINPVLHTVADDQIEFIHRREGDARLLEKICHFIHIRLQGNGQ